MNGPQAQPLYDIARPSNRVGLPIVSLDQAHAPNKMLAHPGLVRKFVNGETFQPIHMRIGIMGACNMRCNFCNFHSPNEENFYDLFSFKHSIPTDKAITLMREFVETGGRAVTFCGSGECTIHPGYAGICDAAHQAGLRVGLITNGSRLSDPKVAHCIARTHTWVRVGMNAGTEANFVSITRDRDHTFPTFEKTPRTLRESAVDPDFRVGFNFVITAQNHKENFVITAQNHKEICLAAELAARSGAHYIRFEPEFYSALGHQTIEDVMAEVSAALDEVVALSTEEFEVSIPKLDCGPMDEIDKVEGDFERCHHSRIVTAVGADGNLYPCPQVHLNSRYLIGNVVKDGYLTVLEGGARAAWEDSNPRRTDLCKSCFYRPQNELLEWLRRGDVDLAETLAAYQVEVPATLHADFV